MIPVCVPYAPSKWGGELQYALRSWDRYFNEDFTVYVLGGEKPDWLDPKRFIRVADDPGKHKEANQGRKLRYCAGIFKEFIWTHDDVFLIGDTCYQFIKRPLYHQRNINMLWKAPKPQQRDMMTRLMAGYRKFVAGGEVQKIKGIPNPLWQMLMVGTADRLKSLNYTAYNGETHTPYVYESEKLSRLSKVFDIFDGGRHICRTAYINVFNKFKSDLHRLNGEKVGYYGAPEEKDITPEQVAAAKFLNFDDRGLTDDVKAMVQARFPEPSRFEVRLKPAPGSAEDIPTH